MARVNVDSQALTDARFAVLAALMGSDDPDLALGRMIRVWMQCYERESYILSETIVEALFQARTRNPLGGYLETPSPLLSATDMLIQAELAERVEGGLRIKGTRGRIEYITEKRANGKRYGHLGAKYGKRGGRPKQNPQTGGVNNPPLAPAPAPALSNTPPNPPSGGTSSHATPTLFERFWAVYPRKTAKPKAHAAFAKHKPTEELLTVMLLALEWQKQTDQWTRDGGQFIPHPATWLNQKRWEDERPPPGTTPQPQARLDPVTAMALRTLPRITDTHLEPHHEQTRGGGRPRAIAADRPEDDRASDH